MAFPIGEMASRNRVPPPKRNKSRVRPLYPLSARRREPIGPALLRQQALREVEPLFRFRQPTLELVDRGEQPLRLAPEHDSMLGGLHRHPLLIVLRPPADPLRQRSPDRS